MAEPDPLAALQVQLPSYGWCTSTGTVLEVDEGASNCVSFSYLPPQVSHRPSVRQSVSQSVNHQLPAGQRYLQARSARSPVYPQVLVPSGLSLCPRAILWCP